MVSLAFDCSAKQNNAVTWFEAQTICRSMNQSITVHTNKSADYYWTGLYERTSYWIKIIGILIKRYRIETMSHKEMYNIILLPKSHSLKDIINRK